MYFPEVQEKKKLEDRQRGKRFSTKSFRNIQKLNGVCFYLHDQGVKDSKDQHFFIKLYVAQKQWNIPAERHVILACVKIQEDFILFTKWFKENHKPLEV